MAETLYDIPVTAIDGAPASLGEYRGKVLLVVNVASKCGLTPQYTGLQQLYEARRGEGLEVLGFPANNFGGQEPGSEAEIQQFCTTQYQVTFPMFSKISVAGADKHPLYAALTQAAPAAQGGEALRTRLEGFGIKPNEAPELMWNFEKFLIGRDGTVIARFAPDTTPDDPKLKTALDAALAA